MNESGQRWSFFGDTRAEACDNALRQFEATLIGLVNEETGPLIEQIRAGAIEKLRHVCAPRGTKHAAPPPKDPR